MSSEQPLPPMPTDPPPIPEGVPPPPPIPEGLPPPPQRPEWQSYPRPHGRHPKFQQLEGPPPPFPWPEGPPPPFFMLGEPPPSFSRPERPRPPFPRFNEPPPPFSRPERTRPPFPMLNEPPPPFSRPDRPPPTCARINEPPPLFSRPERPCPPFPRSNEPPPPFSRPDRPPPPFPRLNEPPPPFPKSEGTLPSLPRPEGSRHPLLNAPDGTPLAFHHPSHEQIFSSQQPTQIPLLHEMLPVEKTGVGLSQSIKSEKICKQEDQKWICDFITSRKKPMIQQEKKLPILPITIPEAQALLREALRLTQELTSLRDEAINSQRTLQQDLPHSFSQIQARLSELEQTLTSPEVLQQLQQKTNRAKLKRKRIRCQKEAAAVEEEETLGRRQQLHARIDSWQASIVQKELEIKQAKELKKSADSILAEVRRKQLHISQADDLVKAIATLRECRREKAEKTGILTPQHVEDLYDSRQKVLTDVLEKQRTIYMEEERVLEVMMEVEQKETSKMKQHAENLKLKRKLKQFQRKLQEYLFGKEVPLPGDHPLYPFRKYYNAAQRDFSTFIQIRQDWDAYLVPPGAEDGSALPAGWVQPAIPSNKAWASALRDYSDDQK